MLSTSYRCVAGVCCKSARHWLSDAHRLQMGVASASCCVSGDNCRHCNRLHYHQRPAEYIIGVKPERSETTRRLVSTRYSEEARAGQSIARIVTQSPVGERGSVMNGSVCRSACMYVCLSVCLRTYLRNCMSSLRQFLCMPYSITERRVPELIPVLGIATRGKNGKSTVT